MKKNLFLLTVLAVFMTACDPMPMPPIPNPQPDPEIAAELMGFYLLCEGNMGDDDAALDYYHFGTQAYAKNVYASVGTLGDIGNDIGIYKNHIFIVLNGSNKIVVLRKDTRTFVTQIPLNGVRYISFAGNKAYASAYNIAEPGTQAATKGIVAEIELDNFTITKTVEVGRQPEQMAIVGSKLYVANSGGYQYADAALDYETTISVININTFQKIEDIETGVPNLFRIQADSDGDLYVASYSWMPSAAFFVIDPETKTKKKTFDFLADGFCIANGFVYSYYFDMYAWEPAFCKINTATDSYASDFLTEDSFDDNMTTLMFPYGIAVDPKTGSIFLADNNGYSTTTGSLNIINTHGEVEKVIQTNAFPGHFAFDYK